MIVIRGIEIQIARGRLLSTTMSQDIFRINYTVSTNTAHHQVSLKCSKGYDRSLAHMWKDIQYPDIFILQGKITKLQ